MLGAGGCPGGRGTAPGGTMAGGGPPGGGAMAGGPPGGGGPPCILVHTSISHCLSGGVREGSVACATERRLGQLLRAVRPAHPHTGLHSLPSSATCR